MDTRKSAIFAFQFVKPFLQTITHLTQQTVLGIQFWSTKCTAANVRHAKISSISIPCHQALSSSDARLVIFPMSGNSTFETSDFAGRRFSFRNRDVLFSPTVFLWKKILRNIKQYFSLPELAHKRNFLGV